VHNLEYIAVILLIFNIMVFEIYSKRMKIRALEQEKAVYVQQIELMNQGAEKRRKSMQEFYEEQHNLLNKLVVLKQCAAKNDKEHVMKEIDRIISNCDEGESISATGNETVDALINFKYVIAREQGIVFCLKAFIPEVLPLEPCDIGIILGNAIDNAMEAVRECRKHEKCIDICIGIRKESLVFFIRNPYEHFFKRNRKGNLISTKQKPGRHGYGVNSIKRVVEKYNGEVFIEAEDNYFSLTAIVPLIEI